MKKIITLTLILLSSILTQACDSTAKFKTSSQESEIKFLEIRKDFPSSGYTTLYYSAYNAKGKDLSHFNLKVDKCVEFEKAGLYNHRDTLKASSCFSIGKDGSDKVDYMWGIKYDCGLNKGDSIKFFIVLEGNYEMDADIAKIKYGTTFTSSYLCLPKCKSLPVKLLSFSTVVDKNELTLNWSTASEVNNHGFYVQFSIDNTIFENISFIESHHNSTITHNYTYRTTAFRTGYYRLLILDFDGAIDFSSTLYLKSQVTNIYPIPVHDILNVGESVSVKLFSINGEFLKTLPIENGKCDLSMFNKGLYILILDDKYNLKLLKDE